MINAIQNFDASVLLLIQDNLRFPFLNFLMIFITKLGDAGIIWIATGVFFLVQKRTRRGGFVVLMCLLAAYLINDWGLKLLVARPRPYATIDGLSILVEPLSSYSFPSGHANSSFAAALALTLVFGKKGLIAYIPAVLIAFSRCYVGVHYPSDVFGGALVGTLVSLAVYLIMTKALKFEINKRRCD